MEEQAGVAVPAFRAQLPFPVVEPWDGPRSSLGDGTHRHQALPPVRATVSRGVVREKDIGDSWIGAC
jgi:hypothetical protein